MQFKLIKNKKNFRKVSMANRPHFFWMLLLAMMTLIIALSCVWGFFLFIKVNSEPSLPVSGSFGAVETVDRTQLNTILDYFRKREVKMNEILYTPLPLVDPSI